MPARHPADLLQAQLRAVDAWHAARLAEQARALGAVSREQRLDLARRTGVLREQHAAIVERTQAQLLESAGCLRTCPPVRAVVAHRSTWFSDKVCAALHEQGVVVVSRITNGARAVGVVVAEQPDLLLVDDVLPMMSGVDVVRQVRGYAPETLIGAHVAHVEVVGELLDAGAHGAWARHVPPVDVAEGLVRALTGQLQPA